MDIEFIPKIRGGKYRLSTFNKIEFKIEDSIKAKRRADLEAMSQEDKIDNHYTAILPEIPKTKKGIDKAIDVFINDFTPDTDSGENLLEYLGFYDIGEGIEEGDHTIRAMYLRERIKKVELMEEYKPHPEPEIKAQEIDRPKLIALAQRVIEGENSYSREEIIGRIYRDWETDRKSTRLNSSHSGESRMPSSA